MSLSTFVHLFRKKKALLSSVSLISISVISLLLFFQNCGKAGFDSNMDLNSASNNPANSAPFAYEASVDMITYNSCNSTSSQNKTFTFRAGSYDSVYQDSASGSVLSAKSGVRLRKEFIDYAYKTLKPDYPNPDLTAEQITNLIQQSDLNSEIRPQISIRSINKNFRLGSIISKSGSPSMGIDVLTPLGDLSDTAFVSKLIGKAFPKSDYAIPFLDYFSAGSSGEQKFEAALSLNSNEQTAENIRKAFNKDFDVDAQLVVGFSHTGEGALISDEANDTDLMNTAYGRGFQMTFSNPSSWAYHPNNHLNQIKEYDLRSNTPVADAVWDCNLKMYIVREQDAHFDWQSVQNAVVQKVNSLGLNDVDKPGKINELMTNIQTYYGVTSAQIRVSDSISAAIKNGAAGGFCPKMDYFTLSQLPDQSGVYGVGVYKGKTYGQILEIVRRHLPSGDWDINLKYKCAVPKKFSCYPDEAKSVDASGTSYGMTRVANTVNSACYHKFENTYYKANKPMPDNAAVLPTDYCNEFVSICTKR